MNFKVMTYILLLMAGTAGGVGATTIDFSTYLGVTHPVPSSGSTQFIIDTLAEKRAMVGRRHRNHRQCRMVCLQFRSV